MKKRVEELLHPILIQKELTVAVAESCTGGALAARLSALSGASAYFLGALVVYSNAFKKDFLHVKEKTLEEEGAVSEKTVAEMLEGLISSTTCDIALAVSGVAGPTGGTLKAPVGTVFIGIQFRKQKPLITRLSLEGDRATIIQNTIEIILNSLLSMV